MKRLVLWSTGILLVAIVLAFSLSPWPRVALITYVFSQGDRAANSALEKHAPAGVVARRDIKYGDGRDEVFDLYYLESVTGPQPTIVWVHGGGFVAGSKESVANYMKVLAGHGYTTVALGYSRGYGAAYPESVEQVNTALAFLIGRSDEFNIDPRALVLAGSSAGAHISSQVALITTDPTYANALGIQPKLKPDQIAAMLLMSGVYDPSALNFEGGLGWFIKAAFWAYLGVRDFRADDRFGLMSVTQHVTNSFPPAFISSGNGDPLAKQAIALAERLTQLGVRIDTLFFPPDRDPALPHEYQFNLDEPAGRQALNRMLAFLGPIRARASAAGQSSH